MAAFLDYSAVQLDIDQVYYFDWLELGSSEQTDEGQAAGRHSMDPLRCQEFGSRLRESQLLEGTRTIR